MCGVPLIASPPIKHEPGMNYHGYEVTKYQVNYHLFIDGLKNDKLKFLFHNLHTRHLYSHLGEPCQHSLTQFSTIQTSIILLDFNI